MSQLHIIEKKSELEELIHHCKTTRWASVDFETTGLNYHNPLEFPTILGCSFQPGSAWILPLGHFESPWAKEKHWKPLLQLFGREVMQDWDIVKVAWNFKFEYKWFMRYGIFAKGRLFDGMLAKYCLNEEIPHGLKEFVRDFFRKYANYEEGNNDGLDWRNKPMSTLAPYCGLDCDLTLQGMVYLENRLMKLKFYNLFRNLLMTIMKVLAESEYRGMLIDRPYLDQLAVEYAIKIEGAEKGLHSIPAVLKYERKYAKYHIQKLIDKVQSEIDVIEEGSDEEYPRRDQLIRNREQKISNISAGILGKKETYDGINLQSPKQLGEFLFKSKFGLRLKPHKYTVDKKTKQPTKTPSTDEESLLILKERDKSGFMEALMDHRGLTKLNSTYIAGMQPLLDAEDRVHANFKIHGTVTGRLSCSDPNLQNIPRGTTAKDIKTMFIVPQGYLLLEVDYSQAELRVIAELAHDKAMIDIFKRNFNIHVATACKMYGGLQLYDKVKDILKDESHPDWLMWEKRKKKAKSLNFSIVYQQGDKRTAADLEVSVDEAKKFKADWFKEFPGVTKWIGKIKRKAHEDEFVRNLFGRKRRLYDINSPVYGHMLKAERDAVNAPVQGTASDFGLFSQVVIREERLKGNFPRDMLQTYTVHDSIGFYVRPYDIHRVVPKIIKICDNPQTQEYFGFELKDVMMKVSPEVGKTWAGLSDYDQWTNYNKWIE